MTGIERLRQFAKGCRLVGQKAYSNAIGDIADQIEREHNVSDREEHDAAVWVRDHGGLLQSLDFWLSSDIDEESYREAVSRFKRKWFRRTPKNRVEFYQQKLQECADRLKREMGEA